MVVYHVSSVSVTQAVLHLFSSNSSVFLTPPANSTCSVTVISMFVFSTYTLVSLLLLPLYILVLYVGFQQWRRRRSNTPSSHSDVFTYHMVILNICAIMSSLLLLMDIYVGIPGIFLIVGNFLSGIILPGHMLMHCLTCLDLYLASVHPVTYMRLRQTGGARIRNVTLTCVWLLLLGMVGGVESRGTTQISTFYVILMCVLFDLSLLVMLFFCLSVIYVLIRPRPGQRAGRSDRVDLSKQRACHIILVIMGVLLMEFIPLLFTFALYYLQVTSFHLTCVLLDSFMLLTLPGSLILPLLFLHRTGKLKCCRQRAES